MAAEAPGAIGACPPLSTGPRRKNGEGGIRADSCNPLQNNQLRNLAQAGAAAGAAIEGDSGLTAPDLAEVIRAWPGLPEAVRANIVAMVKGARDD
jgi:hypothetical protein